jgi:hypothetical protein
MVVNRSPKSLRGFGQRDGFSLLKSFKTDLSPQVNISDLNCSEAFFVADPIQEIHLKFLYGRCC